MHDHNRPVTAAPFVVLETERLVLLNDPENVASVRVAEKVGMRFDRNHVDEHGPCAIYARSKLDPTGFAADSSDPAASS